MVTDPGDFFEPFARAGADWLTFHAETVSDPKDCIRRIHDLGCRAGLSLNPDRSLELVLPHFVSIDLVLLMSVFPGFSGQSFIPAAVERAKKLHDHIRAHRLSCQLEVDGGINRKTAPDLVTAGADVLVLGSAFFGDCDPARLVIDLKALFRPK